MAEAYSLAQRSMQNALASTPAAFEYGSLDEKYPIQQTRPITPPWIQDEIDQENLKRKTAEVGMKQKKYDMMMLDAKLSEENLRLTQAPEVMKRIGTLNPQSDTYQQDYIKLAQELPYGFNDKNIQDYVMKPLNEANKQYNYNKQYLDRYENKMPTYKELTSAAADYEDLTQRQKLSASKAIDPLTNKPAVPLSESDVYKLNAAQNILARGQRQRVAPTQQTGIPISVPQQGQPMSFNSAQEAESYGLPPGTIVYINGRKARID